ncbi:hypothetical protein EJB05_15729, partial [Eragrostis curvula]
MMAAVKVYVPLFTALFFSGLMQLSMAQDKPVTATARVVDAKAIDQAIAYLLMFAALLCQALFGLKTESYGKTA